ncbi:MAG TPA: DUF4038 domain-containing protein [Chitinophagaceae bacterium]|nr:DUF4038 domain-containing protein [Chitinophagaceae bacterium]
MKRNKQQRPFLLNRHAVPVFLFVLLNLRITAKANSDVVFPLHVNGTNNYLADKNNKPFLLREISAWGLIQALPEKDEAAFIDSVKEKGFNTLLVSIISFDTRFAGNPPAWQGIMPFKKQWDFSTYNTTYFEHADRFLKMAEDKGMLVLLVPCYLGYKGDPKQGWWPKLLSENNSVEKSRIYGEFIGKRYKDFDNIIWVAGGDNKGDKPLYNYLDNIIQGIKQFDKQHLWTGHFASEQGTNWAADNALYAKYIDVNGLYVFAEENMGTDAPQYKTELAKYGKGKMIFQLDQSYEHDIPHDNNNENYQWIRRKNYDGLLSGCAGTSFSPGQKDNQCYVFTNWQPLMNTTGMQQIKYCFNLFLSRAWYRLVPLPQDENVISNRGAFGSIDYVCAARTNDSSTLIAYLPLGGTITVNLHAIKGTQAAAWWYDVRSGTAITAGEFSTRDARDFTAPGNEDWVLVIDDGALKLLPPGNVE